LFFFHWLDDRIDDYDRYDDDYDGRSYGYGKNLAAAAAIKLTRGLMTKLACDLNDTSPEALYEHKICFFCFV